MAQVAVAKNLVGGTVSSLQRKMDKMLSVDEQDSEETNDKKDRKATEKELKRKEKEKKKAEELKAKHEKEVVERQAQRAELRLQMRNKYGLGGDKKDEELVTARKSLTEPTSPKTDLPPWMRKEPSRDEPSAASDNTSPFDTVDDDGADYAAQKEATPYEQRLKEEEEAKRAAKEAEKQRKREEKAAAKREEKERKELEKREAKERKTRLKQDMDQWREKKAAQRSIVDEHQRRQNLYAKYNIKRAAPADDAEPGKNPFDEDAGDIVAREKLPSPGGKGNPFEEDEPSELSTPASESAAGKQFKLTGGGGGKSDGEKKECSIM